MHDSFRDAFRQTLRETLQEDQPTHGAFLDTVQERVRELEDEISLLQLKIYTLERRVARRQQQLEALWRYQAVAEPPQ